MNAVSFVMGAMALLISLISLVLVLGVVRRIRVHEGRLAGITAESHASPVLITPEGGEIGDFTVTDINGDVITKSSILGERMLIGFFSPGCSGCYESLPTFLTAAAGHEGGVLAVVVEDGGDSEKLRSGLSPAARVVLDRAGGPLSSSLEVRGFPAFALVDETGRVEASGFEVPRAHAAA